MLKLAIFVSLFFCALSSIGRAEPVSRSASSAQPDHPPICTLQIASFVYVGIRQSLRELSETGELEKILNLQDVPVYLTPEILTSYPAEIERLERRILEMCRSKVKAQLGADQSQSEPSLSSTEDDDSEVEMINYALEDIVLRPHCSPPARALGIYSNGAGRYGDRD